MPSTIPVTLNSMNYGSVVFVAFLLFAGFYYVVRGRHHYTGPPTADEPVEEVVRRRSSFNKVS